MDMAGRVQTLGTGISGRTIQGRVFDWIKRSFGVILWPNKIIFETRTGVHSNIGSMRTGPQDPDGEEIIDTGLDDMMIDSNINIGTIFK